MNSDNITDISNGLANFSLNDNHDDASQQSQFRSFDPEPPPAPILHSQGVIAMDITKQFINAAQELELGQLVKDPYFTLFEAVGALEIMDRKMDSGYLEPGETMDDNYDFTLVLLPEEIIGIIDQLLCHEMAWHQGYPLSQTIFTSLYIDRIMMPAPVTLDQTLFDRSGNAPDEEPITMQILRAYCLGLIKTCFFVNDKVKAEHYYEEEDFVTHTYNRSLLDSIDHAEIVELLDKTVKVIFATDDFSQDMKKTLIARLELRSRFLTAVEVATSRTSPALKLVWTSLGNCIPRIKMSVDLGKPVPSSFSVKLQRKLASTAPPRPIVHVSQESAFEHLENLCRDAVTVVEVLKYYDSRSLLTFVTLFQARKPQPSVYVRTLLQHYLFGDMIMLGKMSIRQILDEELSTMTLPASMLLDRINDEVEVPSDPRFNIATIMETFRSRAADTFIDYMRTICQNRCRIRRTLCHAITDWDNLQLDAEQLDVELQAFTKEVPIFDEIISTEPIYSFPLSSWAYYYKLGQMEWTVQMGFELEVYQPDELADMYWYLQYLARNRSQHLERIRGFTVPNGGGIAASDESIHRHAEYGKAGLFFNFSSLEAAATYGLADALSGLFTVLNRLSLLPKLPRPYGDAKMRYEVRMKPFLGIGLPELVSLENLKQLVEQPRQSILDLLDLAADSAAAAKKAFEIMSRLTPEEAFCQGSHASWLKNVKDCLKAAIFTGITISTVRKAVIAAGNRVELKIKIEIPESGKGYHDWWVVPKASSLA
ncbi:amino-acid N-acetyltransferas-like protein subunit Mak10 [Calycina marina]|uniref:Amino-acid N-acetyltransferas-like protein subunit Mak10 n=1 Tax=Calycina marina TaxID=1763456 RepID=A0A9P7YX57_9HELO|nr:amino-acid N-acetyltransferas-like protein subunit Mak10 [Calycina marina]